MAETLYIGLDVHKETITTAEDGRQGVVEFSGVVPNTPKDLEKLAERLARHGHRLEFCYEAGCCGYVIYRSLVELGHGCLVAAPSRIPSRPGDKIKTDRRDSQNLAILHRSGHLTAVWVPDEVHEAMRDLVRARTDAAMQLMRSRQQLLAFLLRHGRTYGNGNHWTGRHRRWLAGQAFEQPAHQIVFQDYVEAVAVAAERKAQLMSRIVALLPGWSMNPIVEAMCGLRGIDVISAVTIAAGVGDLSRFETPRQFMAYLGLVPSEHSSGDSVRRGGITKTGNSEARRMLVEASWCYRYPARVARNKSEIIDALPKGCPGYCLARRHGLCGRFRKLVPEARNRRSWSPPLPESLGDNIWLLLRH